jgi:hypothetical protein
MKEFWDTRYSEPGFVYGKEPNKYFKYALSKMTAGKLLLPAEGEGRNAVFAAGNGWTVTAVDFSAQGRDKALKFAEERKITIEYVLSPLEKYVFPENEFDSVALIYAHFPPPLRTQIHNSVAKSLKPGWMLILEAFSKEQINNNTGGPRESSLLYTIKDILSDFSDLTVIESDEIEMELEEGQYHRGKSNIIRLLAKKAI